jgi:hypothetical protein
MAGVAASVVFSLVGYLLYLRRSKTSVLDVLAVANVSCLWALMHRVVL